MSDTFRRVFRFGQPHAAAPNPLRDGGGARYRMFRHGPQALMAYRYTGDAVWVTETTRLRDPATGLSLVGATPDDLYVMVRHCYPRLRLATEGEA